MSLASQLTLAFQRVATEIKLRSGLTSPAASFGTNYGAIGGLPTTVRKTFAGEVIVNFAAYKTSGNFAIGDFPITLPAGATPANNVVCVASLFNNYTYPGYAVLMFHPNGTAEIIAASSLVPGVLGSIVFTTS